MLAVLPHDRRGWFEPDADAAAFVDICALGGNAPNDISAVNIAAIVATLTRSLASAGTLDANGNRVFNLTQFNLVNGATLDIQGGASDFVVLNYGISGDFKPNGTIELTGGITENHVLFNIDAGQTLNAAPIRRLYREYS